MTKALAALVLFLTGSANAYVTEVVIPAGPFHGVHGLSFGLNGELYAGDILGMTVHRIDVMSGKRRVEVGPPLGMADDVAVAPAGTPHAGTIVWTAIAVGRLYAKSPGGAPRVVADKLPSLNTVGFHPDGRLFGTQMGAVNVLWQFDLSGRGEHKPIWTDTGRLNGFVITSDDILYGPQASTKSVIRLDLKTLDVKTVAGGFAWPTGVKMDARGRLFVSDLDDGRVWRVDKETGAKELLATFAPGVDNLTVGPNGKVYVSSPVENAIFELDPDTKATRAVARGRLTAPGGVAVLDGPKPRVFVADLFSLREIDGETGADRVILPAGDASVYPATVSTFRDNDAPRLIVTGFYTNTLAVVDPDANTIIRRETGFAGPRDAIRLDNGSIVVAEMGAKRLTMLAPNGTRTPLPVVFDAPVGLARDAKGAVYVTDAGAGTLSKIDVTAGTATVIARNLSRPEGVAVMADGKVLVVESLSQRLTRIDPATGATARIADQLAVGLEAPDPFPIAWLHNGVAVDATGAIYLTSDRHAALYRLASVPVRGLFGRRDGFK